MFAKSIKKLTISALAASPPPTAVRLRLTVAHVTSLGGYASTVNAVGLLLMLRYRRRHRDPQRRPGRSRS